ncbi:hypothetical protein HanRHA438_Chr16g0771461 [Helianthus annuus]|nr:hypothetical protein HanRHA438_Chr16g0771461 [Helianthus annuus]
MLSPFNKEGVYVFQTRRSRSFRLNTYHMLSPFNKEGVYVFQTRRSRSFCYNVYMYTCMQSVAIRISDHIFITNHIINLVTKFQLLSAFSDNLWCVNRDRSGTGYFPKNYRTFQSNQRPLH